MDPKERHRRWAAFVRSQEPPKKGQTTRSEKLPDQLRADVEANPQKWFDVWVAQGMSWGKVVIEEERKSSAKAETESQGNWTWGHEIDKTMPPEVAAALKRALRGTDQHRTYPGAEQASPEDLAYLEQFAIVTDTWSQR
eukprot:4887367-Pyramimonas_sp.AAC.1